MDRLTLLLLAGSAVFNASANTFMKYAFGAQHDLLDGGAVQAVLKIILNPWAAAGEMLRDLLRLPERGPHQVGSFRGVSTYGGDGLSADTCGLGLLFCGGGQYLEDCRNGGHSRGDLDHLGEGLICIFRSPGLFRIYRGDGG